MKMKRTRPGAAPRLEEALYKWIFTQSKNGVMLNGQLLQLYAKKLLDEANKHLPETKRLDLKFSNGWNERFKKRYGLRFRRVHGEALNADQEAINLHMPRIMRIVMTYAARDIWNAEEFGLFYRQPPGWTLSKNAGWA